jgi:exodeoxyribonuclease-3
VAQRAAKLAALPPPSDVVRTMPSSARQPKAHSIPSPYVGRRIPGAPAPSAIRIATWNINSVRLRLPIVKKLIKAAQPDVICLQETKTEDQYFPAEALAKSGYPHQCFYGMKGYNGVAILSRHALAKNGRDRWCDKDDSRHAKAELPGGIELHNVYIPAGGDVPDPKVNVKFAHKLQFLRELGAYWGQQPEGRRILVGDLNVAPRENDVWSHKQLLDVVSHTPIEVELLTAFQNAHKWVDATRELFPEPQRVYTWWSYRNRDWRLSDRGRRLDHAWVTPALAGDVAAVHVLKEARDWPMPSDHVPVLIDLKP